MGIRDIGVGAAPPCLPRNHRNAPIAPPPQCTDRPPPQCTNPQIWFQVLSQSKISCGEVAEVGGACLSTLVVEVCQDADVAAIAEVFGVDDAGES
jgi:hypothetical protein